MTSDSYERAGLNSYRFIFAFIGQFIVSGTALSLALYFGKGDNAKGYQYTLILFSIISFILFMITFKTSTPAVDNAGRYGRLFGMENRTKGNRTLLLHDRSQNLHADAERP